MSLERQITNTETSLRPNKNYDRYVKNKGSFLARLGSGSACRSIYGRMGLWGETVEVEGSSNLYAVPFEDNGCYLESTCLRREIALAVAGGTGFQRPIAALCRRVEALL